LVKMITENGDTKVVSTFDKYLSSAPYVSTGIPVHSTLLTTDRHWLKLRDYLFKKLITNNEKVMTIKGRLGQYIQTESCEGLDQNTDCGILEECRRKLMETTLTVVTAPEKEMEQMKRPTFRECQSEFRFSLVELNDIETILTVTGGENYIISINETLFGSIVKVEWSFGNAPVNLCNERYPCSSQRVASTQNQKGLLLVHVVREDAQKPYIGKATMLSDGGQAAFKLLLIYTEFGLLH
uniref:Ig-like domain-containing protein n=1 Tax=Toxocara canis TaxID=6265 RepID=A0A183U196_TOXCA